MSTWFVYVLLCQDQSLYTGVTPDVAKRFAAHISGKGAKYTKSHPPQTIVHTEAFASRSTAQQRESEIKRWSRSEKIKKLGLTI